jgi:mRNA-degrading endonuclease RelE of RelBE toxin-antitoxin system
MYQEQIQIEKTNGQGIFSVRITAFGLKSLKKITRRNQKVESEINKMMKNLEKSPELGRELTSDLYGLRTISSEDGEFRVIYELNQQKMQVMVHAVGSRKNIYQHLARFLKKVMPYKENWR